MVQLQSKIQANTWVNQTWNDYLRIVEDPEYVKAKGYYFDGQMRIETMGVVPDHARENTIIILAIGLFCGLTGVAVQGLTNCSYRKTGMREAQPDISYYVGEQVAVAPEGSSITNLDEVSPPDLAIEIADSSLNDDLGKKRLLYEDLSVAEYWVVDVEKAQIIAFAIEGSGSRRITQSQVLTGLKIEVVQEAIALSQQMDDSQMVAWMMAKFQES